MPCPLNSLAFWPYTTAIASGWSGLLAFADRYLQGDDPATFTSPGNGGASSHGHTYPDHNHIGTGHAHTVWSGDPSPNPPEGSGTAGSVAMTEGELHRHRETAPTSTFTYGYSSATVASSSAHPPYVKCVIVTPDDAHQDIPDSAVVLADSASPPTGFDLADGLGGRPDLADRFILGCLVGAGNGGGDTGGAGGHDHAVTHGTLHTVTDRPHVTFNAGQSIPAWMAYGVGGYNILLDDHHTISQMAHDAIALRIAAPDNTTTEAASNEPAHIKLAPIINTSGAPVTPVGVILGYTDDPANLSANWQECDGSAGTPDCTDRQVKLVTSSPGGGGGADSHAHDWSHAHRHKAHKHYVGAIYKGGILKTAVGTVFGVQSLSHAHSWQCSTTTPTLQDRTIVSSSDDIRQSYRRLIWIKRIARLRTLGCGPRLRESRLVLARGQT